MLSRLRRRWFCERLPSIGQQFLDPTGRMSADSIENIAEVSLRIDLQFLHVMHRLISTAAVWPLLSLPANNQFLRLC